MTAFAPTPVSRVVLAYEAARKAHDAIEEASAGSQGAAGALKNAWHTQAAAAEFAVSRPPLTETDLLLQIGLASSWMGVVVDAIEEETIHRSLALGIATLLENATLFLAPQTACPDMLKEARDHYVQQATVGGGEVAA